MNRIYQGRVTSVEEFDSDAKTWSPMPDWGTALGRHHDFFQDAVNYYSLMMASLAEACGDEIFKREYLASFKANSAEKKKKRSDRDIAEARLKAAVEWAARVNETWETAQRRAISFQGPGPRAADLLKCKPDFKSCEAAILSGCKASKKEMALALLDLLDRADKKDLNQVCVEALPFLCDDSTAATPKDAAQKNKSANEKFIKDLHDSDEKRLQDLASQVDPYLFMTQRPEGTPLSEEDALNLACKQFEKVAKEVSALKKKKDAYMAAVKRQLDDRPLFCAGRKPSGAFPYAVVFRYFPDESVWAALKKRTEGEYKTIKTREEKGENAPVVHDYINALRKNNKAPFEFFTNIRIGKPENERAAWFNFDLAAFMEAIAAPHRYFEDTQIRDEAAKELGKIKCLYDGEGGCTSEDGDEEASGHELPGFKDDARIALLKELVSDKLAYLVEAEDGGGRKAEYSISQRTLRGYRDLRDKWLKLAEKEQDKGKLGAKLKETLKEAQAAHRDDFGSAPLFEALIDEKYQPIWRDPGTKEYHAKDVLRAWRDYQELLEELEYKKRPIRFTPAHPKESPRYFDFPKQNKPKEKPKETPDKSLEAVHLPGLGKDGGMRLLAAIVAKENNECVAKHVRITYSAPRLRRDALRHDGDENLQSAPWLQPMMAALGMKEAEAPQNFAKTKVTLMPYGPENAQLVFPVEVKTTKLWEKVSGIADWSGQFNLGKASLASLRWPGEKKPNKAPEKDWWDTVESFSCLSIDLGQRNAGAYARLEISKDPNAGKSRYIGSTGKDKWYAKAADVGLLKLPGEDAKVWRKGPDGKFAYYQELSGSRGRMPTQEESKEAENLFQKFGFEMENLVPDWGGKLSFPKQNDKLLVAARRYQTRLAKLHRWAFFLGDDKKKIAATREIEECEDASLVPENWRAMVSSKPELLATKVAEAIRTREKELPELLIAVANRILPLRWRSWKWEINQKKLDCGILTQNGSDRGKVKICGQRGLSMARLEQITELRKRFQSMNQVLRRKIGDKAPARRDDSIPDCCPDLLEKLDNMKEQRVNQTAHMILAKALGLELASPVKDQAARAKDLHGSYVKKHEPVSFIVIENLSRYLASQGRAPRENSRLMQWSHRAVTEKLKMLCEVFYPTLWPGSPMILQTPAAYSSCFCSRSGIAGFRAVEVGPGFENTAPWVWLKEKKEKDGLPSDIAIKIAEAKTLVENMNAGIREKAPKRTIFLPIAGGPIFIPLVGELKGAVLQPRIIQADINAAINLGLRATASPEEWSIHTRLRTKAEGKKGEKKLLANEKRRFGDKKVEVIPPQADKELEKDDARNPNYFADFSRTVNWGRATLDSKNTTISLVSGKDLWGTVRKKEWERCAEINRARAEEVKVL